MTRGRSRRLRRGVAARGDQGAAVSPSPAGVDVDLHQHPARAAVVQTGSPAGLIRCQRGRPKLLVLRGLPLGSDSAYAALNVDPPIRACTSRLCTGEASSERAARSPISAIRCLTSLSAFSLLKLARCFANAIPERHRTKPVSFKPGSASSMAYTLNVDIDCPRRRQHRPKQRGARHDLSDSSRRSNTMTAAAQYPGRNTRAGAPAHERAAFGPVA